MSFVKGKHFVVVIYDHEDYPLDKEVDRLQTIEQITYGLFGNETCPTTKRKHLQGYIQLNKVYTPKWIKKNIHPTANFRNARGSLASQAIYISKEDKKPCEWGEPKEMIKGKRNDLEHVRKMLKEKKSMLEVLEEATSFQAIKIAQVFFQYEQLDPSVRVNRNVRWFWGPTGLGKSDIAHQEATVEWKKGGGFYKLPVVKEVAFWNGYCGQKHVILDEYNPKLIPMNQLLLLLDVYECHVNVKQTGAVWRAENIWITCPLSPQDMFKWEGREHHKTEELVRRITEIREFKKPDQDGFEIDDNLEQ